MATEQYEIGYNEGYQDGWNAALKDDEPPQAEKQEPVVEHLWECLGRWSSYLAVNGTEANLAPPNWLLDAVIAATSQPRKEWVGLTDDDWGQLWQDFEDACDELEVAYQEEAQKKHGEGHYYMSSEDQWEYDKRTIRDLVEAKLKEKNGG